MAGLVPAIRVFRVVGCKDVDARHKAGHDDSLRLLLVLDCFVANALCSDENQ
jgi:hypothetical protein